MDFYKILACPECGTALKNELDNLICISCGKKYLKRRKIPVLLPEGGISNQYSMNYIDHYTTDAEVFDYFAVRACSATEQDELRLRQRILSLIPKGTSLILDAGSGGAWIAKELSPKGISVVSFDISVQNTENAIKKIPNSYHFAVVGDGLAPPFKLNTFDCIISSEVVEHIVEPAAFIQKLFSLIKPGGKLIISVPYKEMIQNSLCIHCNRLTPRNAHLHSLDENKMRNFYEGNDLKSFKYHIFGNKALTILRFNVLVKFLPLSIWKILDKMANLIVNKPAHIIVEYIK